MSKEILKKIAKTENSKTQKDDRHVEKESTQRNRKSKNPNSRNSDKLINTSKRTPRENRKAETQNSDNWSSFQEELPTDIGKSENAQLKTHLIEA